MQGPRSSVPVYLFGLVSSPCSWNPNCSYAKLLASSQRQLAKGLVHTIPSPWKVLPQSYTLRLSLNGPASEKHLGLAGSWLLTVSDDLVVCLSPPLHPEFLEHGPPAILSRSLPPHMGPGGEKCLVKADEWHLSSCIREPSPRWKSFTCMYHSTATQLCEASALFLCFTDERLRDLSKMLSLRVGDTGMKPWLFVLHGLHCFDPDTSPPRLLSSLPLDRPLSSSTAFPPLSEDAYCCTRR